MLHDFWHSQHEYTFNFSFLPIEQVSVHSRPRCCLNQVLLSQDDEVVELRECRSDCYDLLQRC